MLTLHNDCMCRANLVHPVAYPEDMLELQILCGHFGAVQTCIQSLPMSSS